MSSADDDTPGRPSDRPDLGRKRARLLVVGVILAVVVVVFGFMLLVSQCGGNSGDVYGSAVDVGTAVPATSAV